jgi:hypothetical protein
MVVANSAMTCDVRVQPSCVEAPRIRPGTPVILRRSKATHRTQKEM